VKPAENPLWCRDLTASKTSGRHDTSSLIGSPLIWWTRNMVRVLRSQISEQVSNIVASSVFSGRGQTDEKTAFDFEIPPAADKCATPAALRAPEIVIGRTIGHEIEIWSFGCLIYEFLTGHVLFQVSSLADIPQEQNDDDRLLQMIDALGKPSPKIFAKWSRHARYSDGNLKLIRSDVSSSETAEGELYQGPDLEEAFREVMTDKMNAEEVASVLGLLRKVLQYEPDLRPSTSELLRDPWFQSIDYS
jgi:serine/threonine protein kinase